MFKELPLWKRIIYVVLLLLPLALAILWIYYLNIASSPGVDIGTFLSPANNKPIIIGLSIFIAGYAIFLFIMFYSNIKEMIGHTPHKE